MVTIGVPEIFKKKKVPDLFCTSVSGNFSTEILKTAGGKSK